MFFYVIILLNEINEKGQNEKGQNEKGQNEKIKFFLS